MLYVLQLSTIYHSTRINPPFRPFLENMTMKQLLTLTLVAVLGFAVIGCNKTEKVNAGATAATQCNTSNCDPANCDMTACAAKKANCSLAGTSECPMAARAAKAKPAAAGTSACCASKGKAKPAAAGDASGCSKLRKGCDKTGSTGCPMSGK